MVRKKYTGVPLIVATLLKPELAENSLGRTLSVIVPGKTVGLPSKGMAGDILIVRPDDLGAPETERMIQGFFK